MRILDVSHRNGCLICPMTNVKGTNLVVNLLLNTIMFNRICKEGVGLFRFVIWSLEFRHLF